MCAGARQVPSNMVLVRVGAPLWLGVIVVSWGVVATAFAGLRSVSDFYLLRFLLGVTECGTFPGMWCGPHSDSFGQAHDVAAPVALLCLLSQHTPTILRHKLGKRRPWCMC